MSIEKVTKTEEISLKDNICPDCSGVGFLEGPCGGGSINIICANDKCKARFNSCGPFGHERLSYGLSKIKVDNVLPIIADKDIPPMPKCKPPKPEAEVITIDFLSDITNRLEMDGDLRAGRHFRNYRCMSDDDLGFYQQACEFLIQKLAEIQTCKEGHKFIAKSHEYVCPLCRLDTIKNHLS